MINNIIPFANIIQSQRGSLFDLPKVLAFDPGETVGWAFMNGQFLDDCGQHRTTEFTRPQIMGIGELIRSIAPNVVVCESYRVYGWKTESHANNELHTSQIIGIIRSICLDWGIPYAMQSAQIAKGFCTDEKLQQWGFWQTGQKHARDAIRHAAYYQIFGALDKCWTAAGTPNQK